MANHYHKSAKGADARPEAGEETRGSSRGTPDAAAVLRGLLESTSASIGVPQGDLLLTAIQTFISTCRRPAVLEYGDEPQPLTAGEYVLEMRGGKLWIEVWAETRSVARRVLAIERHSTGVLDCTIHRFGGKPGKLSFLDLDRPQSAHKKLCGIRQNFTEQFRRMLFRQFPGWDVSALTCSLDLRRSFSAIYPRARLALGNRQIAALACPTVEDEPALLTSALLWYDHVCTHSPQDVETSLTLFLPETAGNLTAHRLRWLTGGSLASTASTAGVRLIRFNAHGSAGEVDPHDLGNLDTRVSTTAANPKSAEKDQGCSFSERRLEAAIRCNLAAIDPTLAPSPVHAQVLTFAATDRDLIDLLAVSFAGRLAVLELKVSEDLHLPIQALDYWMRVRWHAQRGELQHLFPQTPLENTPPKLLLVAPAMAFHSSNCIVLRYFSPEIEVERVGINSDWQQHLKVVMRLEGAAVPISHGGS